MYNVEAIGLDFRFWGVQSATCVIWPNLWKCLAIIWQYKWSRGTQPKQTASFLDVLQISAHSCFNTVFHGKLSICWPPPPPQLNMHTINNQCDCVDVGLQQCHSLHCFPWHISCDTNPHPRNIQVSQYSYLRHWSPDLFVTSKHLGAPFLNPSTVPHILYNMERTLSGNPTQEKHSLLW